MPDVWTKHPDIVRDLLKEAGFTCGAEGRFLKGRDPAWTCIYDGRSIRGDLYIHHVDQLKSSSAPDPWLAAGLAPALTDWSLPLLVGLVVGLGARRLRRSRGGERRAR